MSEKFVAKMGKGRRGAGAGPENKNSIFSKPVLGTEELMGSDFGDLDYNLEDGINPIGSESRQELMKFISCDVFEESEPASDGFDQINRALESLTAVDQIENMIAEGHMSKIFNNKCESMEDIEAIIKKFRILGEKKPGNCKTPIPDRPFFSESSLGADDVTPNKADVQQTKITEALQRMLMRKQHKLAASEV